MNSPQSAKGRRDARRYKRRTRNETTNQTRIHTEQHGCHGERQTEPTAQDGVGATSQRQPSVRLGEDWTGRGYRDNLNRWSAFATFRLSVITSHGHEPQISVACAGVVCLDGVGFGGVVVDHRRAAVTGRRSRRCVRRAVFCVGGTGLSADSFGLVRRGDRDGSQTVRIGFARCG